MIFDSIGAFSEWFLSAIETIPPVLQTMFFLPLVFFVVSLIIRNVWEHI